MWTQAPVALPAGAVVALALKSVDADQRHIGIVYRPADTAPLRLLHLARHYLLLDHELRDGYRSVQVAALPLALQPLIVTRCKQTAKAHIGVGLPYGFGFRFGTATQDKDTGVITLRGHSGVTCATFVLLVFDLAAVMLADLATWKDRPGDAAWKEKIIEALREDPKITQEHLDAVERDKGRTRVRPEDVAGAATVDPFPAPFSVAVTRSDEILTELGQ